MIAYCFSWLHNRFRDTLVLGGRNMLRIALANAAVANMQLYADRISGRFATFTCSLTFSNSLGMRLNAMAVHIREGSIAYE